MRLTELAVGREGLRTEPTALDELLVAPAACALSVAAQYTESKRQISTTYERVGS